MATPLFHSLESLPARCLVGVSGGVDSVALLHALVAAGKQPVVMHFDHGWRAESAEEACFVQTLAATLKVKCVVGHAARSVKKTEQGARAARWEFFARTARRLRCPDLVLAHHADDQVETFLLQLLRGGGSGANGMRGFQQRSGLRIHRPWLGIWRKEITAYARRHHLAWKEDASNRDTRLLRNRLRHRLIPYLQKNFSKDAPQALWRAAEILGAESEWVQELVSALPPDTQAERLPVKTLRALPLAPLRRVVRQWLTERGIRDVSYDDVEAVRGLIVNRFPAKINLAGGHHARRQAGFLFID